MPIPFRMVPLSYRGTDPPIAEWFFLPLHVSPAPASIQLLTAADRGLQSGSLGHLFRPEIKQKVGSLANGNVINFHKRQDCRFHNIKITFCRQ